MINLITGTPGSGKTSYSLKFMLDQLAGSKRKIYVHGIPNLKIPHEKVYCSSKTCDSCNGVDLEKLDPSLLAVNWHLYAPDGAVYFLDEAQNIYRPRSSASKIPDSVASFEVHRHRGLDFFLITQNPSLIDANIRALVSRHIHLKPTWAGRFQYEWPETKSSVQSTSDAIKSTYKLDKKTFSLYKSASIHTKQDRKTPFVLYVLLGSFLLVFALSFKIYDRLYPAEKIKVITQIKPDLNKGEGVRASASNTSPLVESVKVDYTFKELARASYRNDFDVDRLSTDSCFNYNASTFKCFIPYRSVKTFKNSYCNNEICYALIRIPSLNTTILPDRATF